MIKIKTYTRDANFIYDLAELYDIKVEDAVHRLVDFYKDPNKYKLLD